ncbi:hypothetical protein NBRC116584_30050 [Hydrogenophaga sp. 5NK40-0174]
MYAILDELIQGLHRGGLTVPEARSAVLSNVFAAAQVCVRNPLVRPRDFADAIAKPGTYTGLGLSYIEEHQGLWALEGAVSEVLIALRERKFA